MKSVIVSTVEEMACSFILDSKRVGPNRDRLVTDLHSGRLPTLRNEVRTVICKFDQYKHVFLLVFSSRVKDSILYLMLVIVSVQCIVILLFLYRNLEQYSISAN